MKGIILTIAVLAFFLNASAQTDSTKMSRDHTNTNVQQSTSKTYPDGYSLQKGKVMMSRSGKMTTVENQITFNDGSVLKSDGTLIRKDGSKVMIKDGEYVDLTGKHVKSDKSKDMYLVPDSTREYK